MGRKEYNLGTFGKKELTLFDDVSFTGSRDKEDDP